MTSRWDELFAIAYKLIDDVNRPHVLVTDWSFGGGTAMMLQINHRESHDVDIFLDDPQLLPLFNPTTNDLIFETPPAAYEGDGSHFQKMVFTGIGEIDFIVAGLKSEPGVIKKEILGRQINLETVEEIVCKKIFYRGASITPRDIFDIAAASESGRKAELCTALAGYPDKCSAAIDAVIRLGDEFLQSAIDALMITPDFLPLRQNAKSLCLDVLVASAG
jgi:hypothetical protein